MHASALCTTLPASLLRHCCTFGKENEKEKTMQAVGIAEFNVYHLNSSSCGAAKGYHLITFAFNLCFSPVFSSFYFLGPPGCCSSLA
jgi:hypothetical protein